ncbi:MAG: hypothetical protein KAH48_03095 [Chlorobi bacterium]|nr:hypothetical protein [Chlorobiota bacterium]
MKTILFLLLIISFASCTCNLPEKKQETQTYISLAESKLGGHTEYVFNSSKNYVLCVSQAKATVTGPIPPLNFLVYDVENSKLLYERHIAAGTVAWKSNTLLEISETPGIIGNESNDEDHHYIYDLELEQRIILNLNKE